MSRTLATGTPFSIMTERVEPGDASRTRMLRASGALDDFGGSLAYCAVTDLLAAGWLTVILDLAQVTSVDRRGSTWLRRARSEVEAAGGSIRTVGEPTSPGPAGGAAR